uniref:Glycosyltransferase n=2 Tax=Araucaria cunninghamii TaxID=56994 RepID=A0A0D6QRE5_ARACU
MPFATVGSTLPATMEDEKQLQRDLHIVMFPWLAHGHINPFLGLANSLRSHGFRISFVSTPRNIARIKSQLSQSQTVPRIELVELPLPLMDGLPAGVESSADLKRGGSLPLLVQALDRCQKPFEALLQRLSPDFVIFDNIQYWTARVAAKLEIPAIFFSTYGVAAMTLAFAEEQVGKTAALEHLTEQPPGFPTWVVRRRPYEMRKIVQGQSSGTAIDFVERLVISVKESCATVCNSTNELEGTFMEYWRRSSGRPVLPVGVLMPSLPPRPPVDRCLDWLDRQGPRSVVVVSFGSDYTPTGEEIAAVALGLEESLLPFLYILLGGPPLPQGFDGRTLARGLVVNEWAPQSHILSHPSTGALLTHCGWNSLTEALRFGVPLVALPMRFDQGINARLIAEVLKVGVEVRRNDEDGCFSKDDISKAVTAVMLEEEGRQIKSKAVELQRVLTRNNCEIMETNIRNFVSMLHNEPNNKHP